MNRNRALGLTLALALVLACTISIGTPTAVPIQPPTNTASVNSFDHVATFVAQTVEAQKPAATATVAPTSVPPTAPPPLPPFGPSTWSGTLVQPWGTRIKMTMVVQKVESASFTAKMSWRYSSICSALMALKGEIIEDLNTASEQNRWAQHPDYITGDRDGRWLRWTQTENQGNPDCYVNVGDWWYAHIRNGDGHLIAIRFMNSTDPQPANGGLDLTLDTP
jgi:hypothetical protein